MAYTALYTAAPWFLFHFARPGAADVIHKGGAQDACYSILSDDPTQFVSGYAKQRQIQQTESSWQAALFFRQTGQHYRAGQIKPEHRCVLRKQLFVAFLFFRRFLPVLFDREVALLLWLKS